MKVGEIWYHRVMTWWLIEVMQGDITTGIERSQSADDLTFVFHGSSKPSDDNTIACTPCGKSAFRLPYYCMHSWVVSPKITTLLPSMMGWHHEIRVSCEDDPGQCCHPPVHLPHLLPGHSCQVWTELKCLLVQAYNTSVPPGEWWGTWTPPTNCLLSDSARPGMR